MVRMLAVMCSLLLVGAAAPVTAQAPVASLTLDEAVSLASAANPTVRAKEFEVQAVGANEITAALRPNPIATWELRLGDHRVLYDVDEVTRTVTVLVVGEKAGNRLFVQGREYTHHESDQS